MGYFDFFYCCKKRDGERQKLIQQSDDVALDITETEEEEIQFDRAENQARTDAARRKLHIGAGMLGGILGPCGAGEAYIHGGLTEIWAESLAIAGASIGAGLCILGIVLMMMARRDIDRLEAAAAAEVAKNNQLEQ